MYNFVLKDGEIKLVGERKPLSPLVVNVPALVAEFCQVKNNFTVAAFLDAFEKARDVEEIKQAARVLERAYNKFQITYPQAKEVQAVYQDKMNEAGVEIHYRAVDQVRYKEGVSSQGIVHASRPVLTSPSVKNGIGAP